MLQNLTDRLSRVVKTMRGQAKLTEENTSEMLREVRLALLEADAALPVVKELIANIKDELALKTMTLEQAIKLLHPKYTDEEVEAVLMEAKTLNDLLNDNEVNELDTQRDNSTERV